MPPLCCHLVLPTGSKRLLTCRSASVAASSSAMSRAIAFSCSWAFVLQKEDE